MSREVQSSAVETEAVLKSVLVSAANNFGQMIACQFVLIWIEIDLDLGWKY